MVPWAPRRTARQQLLSNRSSDDWRSPRNRVCVGTQTKHSLVVPRASQPRAHNPVYIASVWRSRLCLCGNPYLHSRVVPSNVEFPCLVRPQNGGPRTTTAGLAAAAAAADPAEAPDHRKDSESWPLLRPTNYTELLLRSPLVSLCLRSSPWRCYRELVGFHRVSGRAPSSRGPRTTNSISRTLTCIQAEFDGFSNKPRFAACATNRPFIHPPLRSPLSFAQTHPSFYDLPT